MKIIKLMTEYLMIFAFLFSGLISNPAQPKKMTISPVGTCHYLQGGCSDGKYVYMILNDGNKTENSKSAIVKIDSETWKTVDTYKNLNVGHGNDICYNSAKNEFLVCFGSTNYRKIIVLDAETMVQKDVVTLPVSAYSIAYDELQDCYYVGIAGGFDFVKLSSDFKVEKRFTGREYDCTRQTISVHNDRIYFLNFNKNRVVCYDKNGTFIGQYDLPISSGEPENIFFIGDNIFVGYMGSAYVGAVIYQLTDMNL